MYGEKHDSYFLKRTESGYKPQPVNPFKKDKDYILDMEKKFFYQFEEELQQLHILLTKKRRANN